jgi:multiple sugar transport system permease protein
VAEAAKSIVPLRQRLWNPEARLAYLLLAPAVLVLLAFMFYPIVYVFLIALSKTNRISQLKGFVGLKNFISLFKDKQFWQITARSLYWTVIAVAVKTLLGMIIALLLNVKFAGRRVARMLFIIPWASAVPISAILWRWVYHPDYGLLNATLKAAHIWSHPPVWLGYPLPAFVACIWVDIWIGIPFMALVFLAGMQAISEDQYESAYLDGVNWWQKFFYITLPGIRHLVLIATLLSCLWTFNDFNVIFILTRGGPAGTTDILITRLYLNAFEFQKFSPASAMAVVTFFILTALSILYARIYFRQEQT